MEPWKRLLLENKAWSANKIDNNAEFFKEMTDGQAPEFLWIGCSDSRVPAEEITGASPGELFVHRNIANLVVHTDTNLLAVLQYAVDTLKVPHIIVCGHYGCGGVRAALTKKSYGMLNTWLLHIKDTYRAHKSEIDLHDEDAALRRMVELNVKQQVQNLTKTAIVQDAWRNRQGPMVHGWVYGLEDGLITPLVRVDHNTVIDPAYRFEDPAVS